MASCCAAAAATFCVVLQAKPGVKLHMLGETVDGHDLDVLQVRQDSLGVQPSSSKIMCMALGRMRLGALAEPALYCTMLLLTVGPCYCSHNSAHLAK